MERLIQPLDRLQKAGIGAASNERMALATVLCTLAE
jgi:hypothetical protein